jgi:stage II sporulation protein D
MRGMPRCLVALLFLLAPLFASAEGVEVRVLLERVAGEVRFEVAEGHRGFIGRRLLFDTPLGVTWPLSAREGQLVIDGTELAGPLTLAPRSLKVNWRGQEYRGALKFQARGDELLVINVVDLEAYLRGVVPAEMMAAWPLEALKAQAVASRTYTMISLDPRAAFDICATIDCQRYAGIAVEHLRTDRAVAETAGLVLTYDGDFAHTYYHSDSGGALASSAEVWGTAMPYLAARNDVVAHSPHRSWRKALDPVRLTESLAARGVQLGTVRSLTVTAYSPSGRAERVQVKGSLGQTVLSGPVLTSFLREAGLKSTRFTVVADLVVQGDGWGHGVGMSQYGARSLASSGYRFDQILHFYYPQTLLQRLASPRGEDHP